jgi:hypothetical protein
VASVDIDFLFLEPAEVDSFVDDITPVIPDRFLRFIDYLVTCCIEA